VDFRRQECCDCVKNAIFVGVVSFFDVFISFLWYNITENSTFAHKYSEPIFNTHTALHGLQRIKLKPNLINVISFSSNSQVRGVFDAMSRTPLFQSEE